MSEEILPEHITPNMDLAVLRMGKLVAAGRVDYLTKNNEAELLVRSANLRRAHCPIALDNPYNKYLQLTPEESVTYEQEYMQYIDEYDYEDDDAS